MNYKPATPLPWEVTYTLPRYSADGDWGVCAAGGGDVLAQYVDQQPDADYIAHAANAYPRLVAALRACIRSSINGEHIRDARALLAELGEQS